MADRPEYDLLSYPYVPAEGQTDTSRAAAEAIADAAPALRDKVLAAVTNAGAEGITVVETCDRYGFDRFGVQPRFTELRLMRKIADSGLRRKNPSGVNAICWTLPQYVREPRQ